MNGRGGGTLGLCSGLFSGAAVGCFGAIIIVLLMVAAIGGLLAMVWLTVLRQ